MSFARLSTAIMAAGILAATANATITINTNQAASGSLGIVNLENGGPAQTVFGTVSAQTFQFTSNENLVTVGGGQSRVEADDKEFTVLDLRFQLGSLFDRLVFNVDAVDDGTITVNAFDQFGAKFSNTLELKKNGQNFINVASDENQQIARVDFESSVGLSDIAQVRVGGIGEDVAPVPEPGSMALMGAGIAAVVGRRFFGK